MHLGQTRISAQNFLAGSMCTYPGFTVDGSVQPGIGPGPGVGPAIFHLIGSGPGPGPAPGPSVHGPVSVQFFTNEKDKLRKNVEG